MNETIEQRAKRLLIVAKLRLAGKTSSIDQVPIIERLEELLIKTTAKKPEVIGDNFWEFNDLNAGEKKEMLHKINIWKDNNANDK